MIRSSPYIDGTIRLYIDDELSKIKISKMTFETALGHDIVEENL